MFFKGEKKTIDQVAGEAFEQYRANNPGDKLQSKINHINVLIGNCNSLEDAASLLWELSKQIEEAYAIQSHPWVSKVKPPEFAGALKKISAAIYDAYSEIDGFQGVMQVQKDTVITTEIPEAESKKNVAEKKLNAIIRKNRNAREAAESHNRFNHKDEDTSAETAAVKKSTSELETLHDALVAFEALMAGAPQLDSSQSKCSIS